MNSEAGNDQLERSLGPLMLWGLGVGYVISGMYFGTSVVLNGKPHDGYFKMFMFDGDKDQVCATLRNSDNKKIYQWVGFMSSGDVRTK